MLKNWLWISIFTASISFTQSYKIVDTGQTTYYDNQNAMTAPDSGEAFFGQDAQHDGYQPSYTDNGDGTISDNITGLMWSKSPDLNGDSLINIEDKLIYAQGLSMADTLALGGYTDWRIPTTKELYSLIQFSGVDPSGDVIGDLVPFIDTSYFDFNYGDEDAGERIIDAQFLTNTVYGGTVMDGDTAIFGVNFADGRIKGYPINATGLDPDGKVFYVYFVRGNLAYGMNAFVDNSDGTITDNATGLMWTKNDNGEAILWLDALEYAQTQNTANYLGYNDWRVPNVKELQSIVDYNRSPSTTSSAAIDTLFQCTLITDEGGYTNFPFYWSGTTHNNMVQGDHAAYVAFGEGLGWMQPPFGGDYTLMDVHGAGCQRSDPKTGNPEDYPYGFGPQGDVIRIYNYVRLVRDAETTVGFGESNSPDLPVGFTLNQNYPNPFNPETTLSFVLRNRESVSLTVYNILGETVATLFDETVPAGEYAVEWNGSNQSSGVYFYRLSPGKSSRIKRMVLLK